MNNIIGRISGGNNIAIGRGVLDNRHADGLNGIIIGSNYDNNSVHGFFTTIKLNKNNSSVTLDYDYFVNLVNEFDKTKKQLDVLEQRFSELEEMCWKPNGLIPQKLEKDFYKNAEELDEL